MSPPPFPPLPSFLSSFLPVPSASSIMVPAGACSGRSRCPTKEAPWGSTSWLSARWMSGKTGICWELTRPLRFQRLSSNLSVWMQRFAARLRLVRLLFYMCRSGRSFSLVPIFLPPYFNLRLTPETSHPNPAPLEKPAAGR